jgi:hypothetical protein
MDSPEIREIPNFRGLRTSQKVRGKHTMTQDSVVAAPGTMAEAADAALALAKAGQGGGRQGAARRGRQGRAEEGRIAS